MSGYDSMNDKLKSTLKYKVTLIILYFKVIGEKISMRPVFTEANTV